MRHFLYIFCSILMIFSHIGNGNAVSEWEKMRLSINQALEKSGNGVTDWDEYEFGKARLISCRTGVKDLSGLVVGVQIVLNQNWILKSIRLLPSEENSQATVLPVFQENAPVIQSWTSNYRGENIFPIWLSNLNNKDVPLSVLGYGEACSETTGKCLPFSLMMNLMLEASESYPTVTCAALNHTLRTAAVDAEKTQLRADNQILENGDIKVRLTFPKPVRVVEMQSTGNIPLKQMFGWVDGETYMALFRPEIPLSAGDPISFNIRSSLGCYTLNTTVKAENLPNLPKSFSFWIAFWSGLFFFLLSPVWCIWMMPNGITNDPTLFRRKIRQIQSGIFWGIGGLGILWFLGYSPTNWIQITTVIVIMIIALIGLLIRPIPRHVWVITALIILLPKPFWYMIEDISGKAKIFLLIWWFICCCFPLNIWLLFPDAVLRFFKQVQHNDTPAYGSVVRLPYLVLIGWIIVSLAGYKYFASDPIYPETDGTKPALVRVTKPICISCINNRALVVSKFSKEMIYRADYRSEWAQKRKELYQIPNDTFYVYITPSGKEIILPINLTRQKLSEAIRGIN